MRYLFIICLIGMCLAAGSGQTVDNSDYVISPGLRADIQNMTDSVARQAAQQIDSILDTKKQYPGRIDVIPDLKTGHYIKYTWYYRIIGNDSLFVKLKVNRIK